MINLSFKECLILLSYVPHADLLDEQEQARLTAKLMLMRGRAAKRELALATERTALSEPCPHCKALIGDSCLKWQSHHRDGLIPLMIPPHLARVRAAG